MARLDDLEQLRTDLLDWLAEAPVDRKAALAAQFRATIAEIDELTPKESEGDAIDEISQRRVDRRSARAAGSGRAERTS